jgi:hypothetical protein
MLCNQLGYVQYGENKTFNSQAYFKIWVWKSFAIQKKYHYVLEWFLFVTKLHVLVDLYPNCLFNNNMIFWQSLN